MNRFWHWLFPHTRHLVLAGSGLLVWLLLWWLESATGIDDRVRDLLAGLALTTAGDEVLLVAWDDRSRELHGPWPGDEETAVALLGACERRGATAVVYVDLPSQPLEDWPALRERAAASRIPVVAPRLLSRDPIDRRWRLVNDRMTGDDDPFRRGAALLPPDDDGVFRSLPRRFVTAGGDELPPLALVAAEAIGATVEGGDEIGVHCPGPAYSRTPVGAWRLLADDLPAQLVAGRLCLIGRYDALAAPGLITPSCHDGIAMPRLEVQANAIDSLLRGWRPGAPGFWAELLLVLLICWLVTRVVVGLQPLAAIGLALALAVALLLCAAGSMSLLLVGLPLTRLLILIGWITSASLGTDLLFYQHEVLGILAATNKGDWLFGGSEGLPIYDRHDLQIVLQLIDRALAGRGIVFAAVEGEGLNVLGHHGCLPEVVRELERQPLRAPEGNLAGSIAAENLGLPGEERCWCMPLQRDDDRVLAWLICWPGGNFNTRLARDLVKPLLPQLLHQVDPQSEAAGSPELRFGFLTDEYLAAMTTRLQRIAQRGRDERAVLGHALASITVGLILSDGMGRCWYRNPRLAALLARFKVEWSGKHVFTLLSQLTRQPLSQVLDLVEPCYRLNESVDIDVQLPDAAGALRVTVTPATVEGRHEQGSPNFLPAWPNHLMLLLDEVGGGPTAGGATMRRELVDAVTDRAAARVRSLLAALELGEESGRLSAIRKATLGLADLFHVYGGGTGQYSMTFRTRGAAKAIDLGQLVDTVVAEQTGQALDRDIALVTDFGITARNVLGDEQALHASLGTVLHRCLAATRDGALLQVALREQPRELELELRSDDNSLRAMLDDEEAEAGDDSGAEYLPVRTLELERAVFAEAYEPIQKMEGRLHLEADGERGVRVVVALPKLL